MTIRALARVIGVSPSLISQSRREEPAFGEHVVRITSTLGLSLEDLFDASDADETAEAPAPTRPSFVTSVRSGPRASGRMCRPTNGSC